MTSFVDLLLKEHGRKTVTVSTLVLVGLVGWGGMEIGWVPVPASRSYVNQVVTDNTKGLSYLVEKELAIDLDNLKRQECEGDVRLSGVLTRLEDQFLDLIGRAYVHKTCTQLTAAS